MMWSASNLPSKSKFWFTPTEIDGKPNVTTKMSLSAKAVLVIRAQQCSTTVDIRISDEDRVGYFYKNVVYAKWERDRSDYWPLALAVWLEENAQAAWTIHDDLDGVMILLESDSDATLIKLRLHGTRAS